MTLLKRNCGYCKKEFELMYKARNSRKYCSNSCVGKDKKNDPIITLKRNIIIDFKNGCWLYQGYLNKGYGHLRINGKKYPAHRFSYEYHNEPINNNLIYVCHKCDVRNCVNPNHLFLGTAKDNTQDMINKGRKKVIYGENHYFSKLSSLQVKEIKEKLKAGVSQSLLAKEYNCNKRSISSIKTNSTWKHID